MKKIKVAVVTYSQTHRKTQDVLSKLKMIGYNDVMVIATPFVQRKVFKPIYRHRPAAALNIPTHKICRNLNYSYHEADVNELSVFFEVNEFDFILLSGAGLLPDELTDKNKIINAHGGYLPNVRGLDAIKWAIFNGQPIGVTTHFIDSNIDEGILIDRSITPLYFEDTFGSFAQRHYESEIDMLVNAIETLKNKGTGESLAGGRYKANRRMSHYNELIMIEKFNKLRKNSKSYTE
jgi:methionyl-tRNA formyltransferase